MRVRSECFLCGPDPELVYADSDSFLAMLGWGPIGEGYSLIATREHLPSMMDLADSQAHELQRFTDQVRARLRPLFGECVITEHGRIAACVEAVTRTYEPHCLHAHRLVFPGLVEIDMPVLAPQFRWQTHDSFLGAHAVFDWAGQYLYAEAASGTCFTATVAGPVPRRLFRTLVATLEGVPELSDWRSDPQFDLVQAARERLCSTP
jgi:hypothetical protein